MKYETIVQAEIAAFEAKMTVLMSGAPTPKAKKLVDAYIDKIRKGSEALIAQMEMLDD